MALLQSSLDRCLENSVSSASSAAGAAGAAGGAAVVGGRRRVKRVREDDVDDCGRGVVGDCGAGDKSKKKKVNPKEVNGKRFACPFYKHEPAKHRGTKTCCGPGWVDVHRAKEHVYRRHSLKNFCPRCFEHFDNPELLKQHQRADDPCPVREQTFPTITDDQEKVLRTRAKPNCSEEAKWEEMYRTIFPEDEKIPSPYYDTETDPSSRPGGGGGAARSQFHNIEEAREFLRVEIPSLVRPEIEKYVGGLLEEVQEKVNHKTVEIIRDVETKVLRTFHFQEEQASALPAATTAVLLAASGPAQASGEPSPPPSPADYDDYEASGGPEMSKLSQFFDEYRDDEFVSELCKNVQFDLEGLLAPNPELMTFGSFSQDSAYYTSSSSGGQGSCAPMEGGYMHRYG